MLTIEFICNASDSTIRAGYSRFIRGKKCLNSCISKSDKKIEFRKCISYDVEIL